MRASSTMLKGFIFLLIIWNSSPFASGNTTNHLQLLLGCQAVIPCQHNRSDSKTFKWFYKKDEQSLKMQIFSQNENGLPLYENHLRSRVKVLGSRSLVIENPTEDDEGLYWCENCFQDSCWKTQSKVTVVKKETLKEMNKTVYVTAGSSFTQACPGGLTNFKWTFESHTVASNKSIHIVDVKTAGKYICWTSGCDGHWHKLLTINLCVITVHRTEDSSVSCSAMCGREFSIIKPNSTLNVETDTRTVPVDPYRFLNCGTKQMFDGYSTPNSTHGPSNVLNRTPGTEPGYQNLIYGTAAALTCLILMTLLICYLRPRLRKVVPIHFCCCGLNGRVVEETSVVYSSVVIRTPAKTRNNHMTDSQCVYSEIRV